MLAIIEDEAAVPGRVPIDRVLDRLQALFRDFDPANESRVYQPLWHLRSDGAWTLRDDDGNDLLGPEWNNWDQRPKSLGAFRRVARVLAINPADQASWLDPEQRNSAREAIIALLRSDAAPVCHAIAAASEADAAADRGTAQVGDEDGRSRVWAEIVRRRGQRRFRSQLIDVYGGQCAFSGSRATAVLEAAHISPYRGDHTNQVTNGLLLRADLHTLFDLHLISVEPHSLRIWLAPALRESEYGHLHDELMRGPGDTLARPDTRLLETHYADSIRQNEPDGGAS